MRFYLLSVFLLIDMQADNQYPHIMYGGGDMQDHITMKVNYGKNRKAIVHVTFTNSPSSESIQKMLAIIVTDHERKKSQAG